MAFCLGREATLTLTLLDLEMLSTGNVWMSGLDMKSVENESPGAHTLQREKKNEYTITLVIGISMHAQMFMNLQGFYVYLAM